MATVEFGYCLRMVENSEVLREAANCLAKLRGETGWINVLKSGPQFTAHRAPDGKGLDEMICVLTIGNMEKPNRWAMCGEDKSVRICPNRFSMIINNPSDVITVIGSGHKNWMTFYFACRNGNSNRELYSEVALGGEYAPPVYREIHSCKCDVMVGLDASMFLRTDDRIRTYPLFLGSTEIGKTKVEISPGLAFGEPIIFDSEHLAWQNFME